MINSKGYYFFFLLKFSEFLFFLYPHMVAAQTTIKIQLLYSA